MNSHLKQINAQNNDADDDIDKAATRSRKKLIRRPGTKGGKLPWNSLQNAKTWRHVAQSVFVVINIYICVTFYIWVRFYETGGNSLYLE